MKIDYSAIVTKANARKGALKALEKATQTLPDQAAALVFALDYFTQLTTLLNQLDAEGTAMVGSVYGRIRAVGHECNKLKLQLHPTYPATQTHLAELAKALADAGE